MSTSASPRHPAGKHRYTSVVDGIALANDFARSRQTMSEFARHRGVSFNMVRYWSIRARRLASASEPGLVQLAEVSCAGVVEPVPAPEVPTPPPAPAQPSLPSVVIPGRVSASATIEVRLPGGVSIAIGAGFSPTVLSQVIACLGGRSC